MYPRLWRTNQLRRLLCRSFLEFWKLRWLRECVWERAELYWGKLSVGLREWDDELWRILLEPGDGCEFDSLSFEERH